MASFVRWNETSGVWEKAVDPNVVPPTFVHLNVATPTQPTDTVNKAYVDGLTPPAFNGGTITGKLTANGGSSTPYNLAAIEIGNPAGGPPRLSFHWHGTVASQIGMDASGVIRTYDNPGTSYENFAARDIIANNLIKSANVIFPGRIDIAPTIQSSWYIASHASYGLYTNTGLWIESNIFGNLYNVMDPNYLKRETQPTDFTPIGSSFAIDVNYASTYMRHNGWLFVSTMLHGNPNGASGWAIQIPGGFTCQRYLTAPCLVFSDNSFPLDVYIQCNPGDVWIYCYVVNGSGVSIGIRLGIQIAIWVG